MPSAFEPSPLAGVLIFLIFLILVILVILVIGLITFRRLEPRVLKEA